MLLFSRSVLRGTFLHRMVPRSTVGQTKWIPEALAMGSFPCDAMATIRKVAVPETNKASAEPELSDEAVASKTGKNWQQWFKLLDDAGAAELGHKQIVAHLSENYAIGGWWQQTIAGAYERARGLREKHEMPSGFQISRSKTLAVPVSELFEAWHDEGRRTGWLETHELSVRTATPPKSHQDDLGGPRHVGRGALLRQGARKKPGGRAAQQAA